MEPRARILLVYTGGTIGMAYSPQGSLIPFDFRNQADNFLVRGMNIHLDVHALDDPIDSSDVTVADWVSIGEVINARYHEFDGFVVLHGTDTMAYSASALSYMLEGLNKPVIFTGSQLPIGVTRSDARENLMSSLEIAASRNEEGNPRVSEVCLYFSGVLLRGNRARKVQSIHFDAFESENYPPLARAGVTIDYNSHLMMPFRPDARLELRSRFDERVSGLKLFPGMRQEMVSCALSTPGLRGVIMETYGSGNAPTSKWFLDALQDAADRGVILYNVSQCTGGRVIQGRYETSRQLNEIGVLSGGDITFEAAVTKLMYLLGEVADIGAVRKALTQPIRGEMA